MGEDRGHGERAGGLLKRGAITTSNRLGETEGASVLKALCGDSLDLMCDDAINSMKQAAVAPTQISKV
jgi:hypothetical protein